MPVRLNGSTSGYTEIDAPAVAGNNTITFPTTSGTAVVNGANSAIVSGTAVASTSGTSIDFTGIPSWAKRVTVMFNGVSTSGTQWLLRIGSSSGIESASYSSESTYASSAVSSINNTTGFILNQNQAAETSNGVVSLFGFGSNTWIASGVIGTTNGSGFFVGGSKTLSGTLDRVRITTVNGTDTFDAGSINILYE
jgi:hypothetical protein